jgi:hypothetical protein
MDSRGHVTSIHTAHGATVSHGAHGSRTIRSEHVNARGEHIRAVSYDRRHGYVDHTYMRGGHPYMRRTYYRDGHYYARAYPGYYYHGYAYYGYAPAYWYGPAYYGWAYNPWAAPVYYGWGWTGNPWYGYYGYYFNPFPVYASANFWLTDYLLSANLMASYEAGVAAGQASAGGAGGQVPADYSGNGGGDNSGGDNGGDQSNNNGGGGNQQVTLTPEVKQAIADEVKAELAKEKDEAANTSQAQASNNNGGGNGGGQQPDQLPEALDPNYRTFVVSAPLSEDMADGSQCSLSQGDVLTRIDDSPDANNKVSVLVSSSQKGDCGNGAKLSMAVDDLQDMHNAFREKIDDGLKTLADNQGKNGLPASPSTATKENADVKAQPDQDAAQQLADQQKDADDAEKDVSASNSSGGGN